MWKTTNSLEERKRKNVKWNRKGRAAQYIAPLTGSRQPANDDISEKDDQASISSKEFSAAVRFDEDESKIENLDENTDLAAKLGKVHQAQFPSTSFL